MVTVKGFNTATIFVSVSAIERELRRFGVTSLSPKDYACGNWKLGSGTFLQKARQCEWLAAVSNTAIVGVWRIDSQFGWRTMVRCMNPKKIEARDPARKYCRLIDLPSATTRSLLGTKVRLYSPFNFNF